ncbi:MAG: SGNH/GDSL hydrolase family protein [Phyllobacteriaceae bacterium]|nr:SGNH/GDSL hydrolase family protein [Phyllobacteriaceae bacterium]
MAIAPKKMTLGEIRRKANAGALSEAEIKRAFVIDENRSEALAPQVEFNADAVEFKGFKAKPGEAAVLLEKAGRKRRRMAAKPPGKALTAAAKAMAQTKVLAEGDSWFNLPFLIMPKTAMDFLDQTHDVLNLAMWGDELSEMVKDAQYKQSLGSGNFRHFFLSGGGNDILGSIPKYVLPRKKGDTDPANAPKYINVDFANALNGLMKDYAKVEAAVPANTVLYVHGYAYAIPVPGGKYLGKPLKALDFDPVAHSALACAVIAYMVDLFNARLMAFAAAKARVVWIDLRPVVKGSDWHTDEIHPNSNGARKIARRFREAIAATAPVA